MQRFNEFSLCAVIITDRAHLSTFVLAKVVKSACKSEPKVQSDSHLAKSLRLRIVLRWVRACLACVLALL